MRRVSGAAGLLSILGTLLAVGSRAADVPAVAGERLAGDWPFETEDAALDFLRTARIAKKERIGKGTNNPWRFQLEKDGVRARAVFRDVAVEVRNKRVGDRYYNLFRDDYAHEVAAYLVSRVFGIGLVPPTVLREVDGTEGSLQLWLEDVRDESDGAFAPPDPRAWGRQLWEMALFDNLVANVDRNPGNALVDSKYRLWLIDHTRALQTLKDLVSPEGMVQVPRRSWELLNDVSDEELREATVRYFGEAEIGGGERVRALQVRRAKIVEQLRARIAELGEEAVIY